MDLYKNFNPSGLSCEIQPVLTPKQVADIFKVSVQTVKNWCRSGKIKAIKIPSGEWRVVYKDCEEIIEGKLNR